MDTVNTDKQQLIEGVAQDAQAEARRIVQEAETDAKERLGMCERQCQNLIQESEQEAHAQADLVRKRILSGINIEMKRIRMRVEKSLFQEINEAIEKRFESIVSRSDYRSTLKRWIVEAVIGLGAPKAEILTSAQEKHLVDTALVAEVSKAVRSAGIDGVEIVVSSREPLRESGVVVYAGDGRTVFNNQIKTRVFRKQREIYRIVSEKTLSVQAKSKGAHE